MYQCGNPIFITVQPRRDGGTLPYGTWDVISIALLAATASLGSGTAVALSDGTELIPYERNIQMKKNNETSNVQDKKPTRRVVVLREQTLEQVSGGRTNSAVGGTGILEAAFDRDYWGWERG
jgi:hypothetical protein